jgi:hypothetical protein
MFKSEDETIYATYPRNDIQMIVIPGQIGGIEKSLLKDSRFGFTLKSSKVHII